MKLLKVILSGEYKGLHSQTFDFTQCNDSVIAFVGLNGSGKSQLLELICEAFGYLERARRRDFRIRETLPFSVSLQYQLYPKTNPDRLFEYNIYIPANEKEIICLRKVENHWEYDHVEEIELPNYIIGYSSGLNENLQRSFLKNSVQFLDVMRIRALYRKKLNEFIQADTEVKTGAINKLNNDFAKKYPGIYSKDEQSFDDVPTDSMPLDTYSLVERDTKIPTTLFLDYDCNSLLFASLVLLSTQQIDDLLPDIHFRYPKKITIQYDFRQFPLEEDMLQDIKRLIRIAGEAGLTPISRQTSDHIYDLYELDYLAAQITLDTSNKECLSALKEAFRETPRIFFERLYKIQLLGTKKCASKDLSKLRRDDFFGSVKKPMKYILPLSVPSLVLADDEGNTINYDDLSDGEAQLAQVIAAAHIFGEENTLFIWDEPETHLNPSWRTFFHTYLQQAGSNNACNQTFISTHSPFVISSLKKENILHFTRQEGLTSIAQPFDQTYGASFEILIKRFFGLKSAISQTAIQDIRQQIKGDKTKAREWIEENIGDSIEKAYVLNKLGE